MWHATSGVYIGLGSSLFEPQFLVTYLAVVDGSLYEMSDNRYWLSGCLVYDQ